MIQDVSQNLPLDTSLFRFASVLSTSAFDSLHFVELFLGVSFGLCIVH